MSRQALGRGLESLIPMAGDLENNREPETVRPGSAAEIAIDRIVPNPFQPRKEFSPRELDELSASIREKGIFQPVLVRARGDGLYELVAGERRLRAAKLAGLAQVPAVVKHVEDRESLEIALIENLQRADLNAVEAANAYQQLINQFNLTQEQIAQRMGKDRSSITNTLRLLKLPVAVLSMVSTGRLSEGHARALVGLENPEMIERLAEKVMRDQLSVRETERIAKGIKPVLPAAGPRKRMEIKDPHARQLEEELRRKLGTQVRVIQAGVSKGKIEIEYYSLDDLDRIVSLIG